MAAKTSAPFVALLAHFCAFALSQEIKSVAVKSGGDVTLPCMTQEDGDIMIIRWNIPEVNSDEFVFLYHSQTIQKLYMDSKYHNRVELKDPEMKNGDASIVLKNASVTDTGTYECQVSVNRIGRNRRNEPKLTGIVKLQVTDSGELVESHTRVS
ncbi:coxsackievirus and adenovirus receptor homolog [Plectropomus leopardus]|uniref:coxsackievirus and adenovirus receptor homolog n=1 Tax=Plectropomus leopardus TaxID=160734 RepID=UPI001C4C6A0E|nr:coxsackievirus and adenovirus receptor homolog [Plectropomus leopardus]